MKCLLAELVVSHKLLNTLPTWGPAFMVSLDIFINSFDGPNLRDGVWAEVLRFTNRAIEANTLGHRIPSIFTHKDGYIVVPSQIGDDNDRYIGGNIYLEEKTWYKLEITQLPENSKVLGTDLINIF